MQDTQRQGAPKGPPVRKPSRPEHDSSRTLTELRTSRLLEDRRRLRKALRKLERAIARVDKIKDLPSRHVGPIMHAQIEACHALDRSDRIEDGPHAKSAAKETLRSGREAAE